MRQISPGSTAPTQRLVVWGSVCALLVLPATAFGQPTQPTTFNLPGGAFVSGGSTSLFSSNATLTDATGAAGASAGWTYHAYGVANNSNGRMIIDSTSVSTASLSYFTSTAAAPTTPAAPNNFSNLQFYSWTIIGPKPGATAPLWVRADDSTPVDIVTGAGALSLNNFNDLATYNARLNDIYKFNASNFIDPATGVAIDVTGLDRVGDFSYSFSGWDGSTFRTIDLQFTPVPEPSLVLLAAGAGLAFCRVRHMRRSSAPKQVPPL